MIRISFDVEEKWMYDVIFFTKEKKKSELDTFFYHPYLQVHVKYIIAWCDAPQHK